MKVTAAAKVGFTAIVIVLVLVAIYKGMGTPITWFSRPSVGTYQIRVSFESVKGLKAGADVQLNGNGIGEVGDIVNDPFGGVMVTLKIKAGQPIHEHATFIITRENIFGGFVVSIDEHRSGFLDPDIPNNHDTVRVGTGLVEAGGLVTKDGVPVGMIESVTKLEGGRSDRAVIDLWGGVELDPSMAFVPTRPAAGVRGLMVSGGEPATGFRTERVNDSAVSVSLPAGLVDAGALVTRNGDTIGRIVSVEPVDPERDRATVRLVAGVEADSLVLQPSRPIGAGLAGLVIYDQIQPGAELEGFREPGPEDLVADADLALRQITDQATAIMQQLSGLLENVEELLAPEDINRMLAELTDKASAVANNIILLTDRLNSMLAQAEPRVMDTLENIEGLTDEARSMVEGLNQYNDPALREDINEIIANLADASENLNLVLDDIRAYTSDEQLREDVAGTFHEAHARLQEAEETLATVETAIEEATSRVGAFGDIEANAEFRMRYAPDPDHFAGDLNIRFGLEGSEAFAIAGIDDIGENDRANAQIGWWVGDEVSARAGVHRGKLGVGFDWRGDAARFIGDLYDPNDLRWDVYAGYAIMPELDIIVGVEDLFEEDEVNFGVAFRF